MRYSGRPRAILFLFLLSFCLIFPTVLMRRSANSEEVTISAAVDADIEQLVSSSNIPSFQAGIVINSRLVWTKGYGNQQEMDTVFMMGSITKTFTATAVLQLCERGLVSLGEDVDKYLPFSVRNPNYVAINVTVYMLLTHMSGLGSELPYAYSWQQSTNLSEFMNSYAGYNITIWQTRPSLGEFLNGSLSTSGPYYSPDVWYCRPGTEWHYSSTGYLLLGYLVEVVTGQSLADYVQENILSPLDMGNTGFRAADFAGKNAVSFERINGTDYHLPIYDVYDEGAGGLRSTVSDMARYMGAHMNNGELNGTRILGQTAAELMHSEQVDLYGGLYYDEFGLGWFVSKSGLQGHSGAAPGYIANMRYNKTERGSYGIILMLSRGYVLGGNMSHVDNFYSQVNDLLWQEAQTIVTKLGVSDFPAGVSFETIMLIGILIAVICLSTGYYLLRKNRAKIRRVIPSGHD
jgi:CubicO group peptidase (beta-lactamase class C family)